MKEALDKSIYYNAVCAEYYQKILKLRNELKKYRDLEERLECPLDKLIKFSKQETVYTKWGAFTNEIVLVDLNLGRIHITKNRDLNDTYLLYISDYKKTWWIKKDKSE